MILNKNQLEIPINEYCRLMLDSYRTNLDAEHYDYVDRVVKKFFSSISLRRSSELSNIDYHKMMLANYSKSNDINGALEYINDLVAVDRDYKYISSNEANGYLTELSEENDPNMTYDYVYDRPVPSTSTHKPEYVAYKNSVLCISATDPNPGTLSDICLVLELLVELFNLSNLLVLICFKTDDQRYKSLEGIYGQYIGIILMDSEHEFHVELSNYKYNNEYYIDAICSPDTPDPVMGSHGNNNPKIYYLWSYPSNLTLKSYQVLSASCTAFSSGLVSMKSNGLSSISNYSDISEKWPVSKFSEKHKSIHSGSGDKGAYYKLELLVATDITAYGFNRVSSNIGPSTISTVSSYYKDKLLGFNSLKASIEKGIRFWSTDDVNKAESVRVNSPSSNRKNHSGLLPFLYAAKIDNSYSGPGSSYVINLAENYLNSLGTRRFNDGNTHINIPDTLDGYSGDTKISGSMKTDSTTSMNNLRLKDPNGVLHELVLRSGLADDPYLSVSSAVADTSIVKCWVHNGRLKKYVGSVSMTKWSGTDYNYGYSGSHALYYCKMGKGDSSGWSDAPAKWTDYFPFYGGRVAQRNSDYTYYYYHFLGINGLFSMGNITPASGLVNSGGYSRAEVKAPRINFRYGEFSDNYTVNWKESDPEGVSFSGGLYGTEIKKHNLAILVRTRFKLANLKPSDTTKEISSRYYYLYTLLFYRNWDSSD